MKNIELQKREVTGKKVRHLIANNQVPCVVYDNAKNSFNYSIDAKTAQKLAQTATSTTILDVKADKDDFKVVTKDVDYNPLNGSVRHISFMKLDPNRETIFSIPFDIVGIAPAVKNNLGVLIKALNTLEVRCTLANLKDAIVIDISGLEHPGQTITVSDIKLPEGMSLPNDSQKGMAIVTIIQLQKTEEVVQSADATTETASAEAA